jgi:bile acid-coenzyme A ligase
MPVLSYPAAFAALVREAPAQPAVVWEGRTFTRGALDRRSTRLARAYAERGVVAGDRVAIALPNSVEFLEAALAVWKLGAVPTPVSSRAPLAELREILALAEPKLVIGAEGLPSGFEPPADTSDAPLPDLMSPHSQAITSGGSTGRPKLIVDAFPARFDSDAPHYGMEKGAVVLIPGPLFHTGPFLNARETLLRGGLVVLMTRFEPAEALRLIETQRVQWANMVPTMLHRILRLPEHVRARADLSSLVRVFSSGAPCAEWLMRAWIEWIGPERMCEAYGGSERIGGTMISGTEWLAHPGSVGRPTGGREIKVVGPDGTRLPPGEIGEVWMRPPGGAGSTYRYVGAEMRRDGEGWETLGDLGRLDADGYLYLADRRTDMIVTGGENVYPAEVEAALDAHPAVFSSAVIGLPDEDLGQRIHAIVQAPGTLDTEELRAHVAARLSRYKVPRSFELVSEPLRDDAGKVRRSRLREERFA